MSRVRSSVAVALAFILLTAGDCGTASFSKIATGHSAKITVTNDSDQTIFVLLYADDAYQPGNLSPGQSHTIKTRVDGTYHVVVAGSGSQLGNYQSSLELLQTATEDAWDDRDDPAKANAAIERTRTAKQNLDGLFQPELRSAACEGSIHFRIDVDRPPDPLSVNASVTKSDTTWAATCPSASQ